MLGTEKKIDGFWFCGAIVIHKIPEMYYFYLVPGEIKI